MINNCDGPNRGNGEGVVRFRGQLAVFQVLCRAGRGRVLAVPCVQQCSTVRRAWLVRAATELRVDLLLFGVTRDS